MSIKFNNNEDKVKQIIFNGNKVTKIVKDDSTVWCEPNILYNNVTNCTLTVTGGNSGDTDPEVILNPNRQLNASENLVYTNETISVTAARKTFYCNPTVTITDINTSVVCMSFVGSDGTKQLTLESDDYRIDATATSNPFTFISEDESYITNHITKVEFDYANDVKIGDTVNYTLYAENGYTFGNTSETPVLTKTGSAVLEDGGDNNHIPFKFTESTVSSNVYKNSALLTQFDRPAARPFALNIYQGTGVDKAYLKYATSDAWEEIPKDSPKTYLIDVDADVYIYFTTRPGYIVKYMNGESVVSESNPIHIHKQANAENLYFGYEYNSTGLEDNVEVVIHKFVLDPTKDGIIKIYYKIDNGSWQETTTQIELSCKTDTTITAYATADSSYLYTGFSETNPYVFTFLPINNTPETQYFTPECGEQRILKFVYDSNKCTVMVAILVHGTGDIVYEKINPNVEKKLNVGDGKYAWYIIPNTGYISHRLRDDILTTMPDEDVTHNVYYNTHDDYNGIELKTTTVTVYAGTGISTCEIGGAYNGVEVTKICTFENSQFESLNVDYGTYYSLYPSTDNSDIYTTNSAQYTAKNNITHYLGDSRTQLYPMQKYEGLTVKTKQIKFRVDQRHSNLKYTIKMIKYKDRSTYESTYSYTYGTFDYLLYVESDDSYKDYILDKTFVVPMSVQQSNTIYGQLLRNDVIVESYHIITVPVDADIILHKYCDEINYHTDYNIEYQITEESEYTSVIKDFNTDITGVDKEIRIVYYQQGPDGEMPYVYDFTNYDDFTSTYRYALSYKIDDEYKLLGNSYISTRPAPTAAFVVTENIKTDSYISMPNGYDSDPNRLNDLYLNVIKTDGVCSIDYYGNKLKLYAYELDEFKYSEYCELINQTQPMSEHPNPSASYEYITNTENATLIDFTTPHLFKKNIVFVLIEPYYFYEMYNVTFTNTGLGTVGSHLGVYNFKYPSKLSITPIFGYEFAGVWDDNGTQLIGSDKQWLIPYPYTTDIELTPTFIPTTMNVFLNTFSDSTWTSIRIKSDKMKDMDDTLNNNQYYYISQLIDKEIAIEIGYLTDSTAKYKTHYAGYILQFKFGSTIDILWTTTAYGTSQYTSIPYTLTLDSASKSTGSVKGTKTDVTKTYNYSYKIAHTPTFKRYTIRVGALNTDDNYKIQHNIYVYEPEYLDCYDYSTIKPTANNTAFDFKTDNMTYCNNGYTEIEIPIDSSIGITPSIQSSYSSNYKMDYSLIVEGDNELTETSFPIWYFNYRRNNSNNTNIMTISSVSKSLEKTITFAFDAETKNLLSKFYYKIAGASEYYEISNFDTPVTLSAIYGSTVNYYATTKDNAIVPLYSKDSPLTVTDNETITVSGFLDTFTTDFKWKDYISSIVIHENNNYTNKSVRHEYFTKDMSKASDGYYHISITASMLTSFTIYTGIPTGYIDNSVGNVTYTPSGDNMSYDLGSATYDVSLSVTAKTTYYIADSGSPFVGVTTKFYSSSDANIKLIGSMYGVNIKSYDTADGTGVLYSNKTITIPERNTTTDLVEYLNISAYVNYGGYGQHEVTVSPLTSNLLPTPTKVSATSSSITVRNNASYATKIYYKRSNASSWIVTSSTVASGATYTLSVASGATYNFKIITTKTYSQSEVYTVASNILTASSISCIAEDTRILTSLTGSYKLAKDIYQGDTIITLRGDTFVEDVVLGKFISTANNPMYKITLDDNTYIEISGEHPIATSDGYKTIIGTEYYGQLNVDDKVLTTDTYKVIKSIDFINRDFPIVYNFYCENDNFIANNIVIACEDPNVNYIEYEDVIGTYGAKTDPIVPIYQ